MSVTRTPLMPAVHVCLNGDRHHVLIDCGFETFHLFFGTLKELHALLEACVRRNKNPMPPRYATIALAKVLDEIDKLDLNDGVAEAPAAQERRAVTESPRIRRGGSIFQAAVLSACILGPWLVMAVIARLLR